MAKQLNIDLSFNADVSKAKAQMLDLQRSLDQLISSTINNNKQLGIDKEIKQAIDDATKLKVALQAATDTNTGKLNLAKFSESLKNGQMTLQQYAQHLKALGPEGEQSFLKLSKAIVSAETPMRQTNTLLNQMFVTLKNTAKWQISSSIIHGLQGGLQQAFNYAKDLDTSLNNIRIVTGYSTEEMAKFAGEANKAAQALSTTTTSYTDAALIYYQQGIRDQDEIAARTETTIKLANVSRQSAEDVSSQMTAIWNNFDDGSHSLEYYADVITALGATTASSSQEIAKGMQQFAAVADTVGLSYEYAAASLATIVATTRQSESTVGNGLRTIFSRLEGLKLGDTLEDGTDLNKYSAALATVGVNIKDASGELKDMDTILEETAAKWDQLDKAQKVAFATTVGGVRQYTNLIALLDNWNMVQENIDTAKGSEGTLQEQADIYAESWEAAEKRVRAAAQKIYKDLIDEKFFIKLGDLLTGTLNIIDDFINAIGGIPGVIAGVGVVLTTVFGKQLSESINSAMYEFSRFTGKAEDIANVQRQDAIKSINDYYNTGDGSFSSTSALLKQEVYDSYELQKITANLTDQQKAYAQAVLKTSEQYHQLVIESEKVNNNTSKQLSNARGSLVSDLGSKKVDDKASINAVKIEGANQVKILESKIRKLVSELAIDQDKSGRSYDKYVKSLEHVKRAQEDVIQAQLRVKETNGQDEVAVQALAAAKQRLAKIEESSLSHREKMSESYQLEESEIEIIADQILKLNEYKEIDRNKIIELIKATGDHTKSLEENIKIVRAAINNDEELRTKIENLKTGFQSIGTGAVDTLRGVSQLSLGITSLGGAIEALNNTELTAFEKFSRVTMGLSMGISQFSAGLPYLNKGIRAVGEGLVKVIPGLQGTAIGAAVAEKSFIGLAASAGLTLAAFAVLAIIGAVIVKILKDIEEASPEKKLERLKEEAEKARERLEEVKQTANDVKAEFDDYDSIVDKLKSCAEGTKEWKDALSQTQTAASNLITKYKLLEGKDWNWNPNGGYQEITEAGKAKVERAQTVQIANASIDSLTRSIYANDQQKVINNNNKDSSYDYESSIGKYLQDFLIQNVDDQNALRAKVGYDNDGSGQISYDFKPFEELLKQEATITEDQYRNFITGLDGVVNIIDEESNELSAADSNFLTALENVRKAYKENENSINGITESNKKLEEANILLRDQILSTANKTREGYTEENEYAYSKNMSLDTSNDAELRAKYSGLEDEPTSQETLDMLEKAYGQKVVLGSEDGKYRLVDENGKIGDDFEVDIDTVISNLVSREQAELSAKQGDAIDIGVASIKDLIDSNTNLNNQNANFLANQVYTMQQGNQSQLDLSGMNLFEMDQLSEELGQSLDIRLQTIADYIKDALQNVTAQDWLNTGEQSVQTAQTTGQVESTLTSGKDLSEDQIAFLDQLEEKYSELAEIQDRSSHEYLSTLREIQEQEEKNAIIALTKASEKQSEEADKAFEELEDAKKRWEKDPENSQLEMEVVAKTKALEDKLKELQNTDYKIQMQIEADLKSDVDQAFGIADEIEQLKSYIDSDLEISFARAQEIINAGYGAMLQGATETANSTIKLNKDVLNNFIDDKQAEIESDRQAKIAQLQSQKEVLLAQRSALSNKLTALGEALTATNAMEAATALQNAQTYDSEYQSKVDELNAQLTSEGEKATESASINEQLFNNLGTMYETDSRNQQQAEVDATNQQATQINQRINNVQALYNAYQSLSAMIRASATGGEGPGFSGGRASGSGGVKVTSSEKVSADTFTPEKITVESLESMFDENGSNQEYKDTIQAQIDQTQDQLNAIDAEIGSIDAGIAALNSANTSLDHAQNAAGTDGTGGSSGSGGKEPEKKELTELDESKLKNLEKERDRYHDINNELDTTDKLLSKIGAEKDRAFGSQKVKKLREEEKVLDRQIKQYKELQKQAQAYMKQDAQALKNLKTLKGESFLTTEVITNEVGQIVNYEKLQENAIQKFNDEYKRYIAQLNEAELAYNANLSQMAEEEAKKIFEETKKNIDKEWEYVQNLYSQFESISSNYESAVAKALEAEQGIDEGIRQKYDDELQEITYIIELKVDIEDRDIALLQDYLEDIGDKADGAADAIANFGKQLDDTLNKVDHYTNEVSKILEHAGADDDLIDDVLNGTFDENQWDDVLSLGLKGEGLNEEEIEKLKGAADALLSMNKEMRSLREEALKKTGEAFDEFNEKLERGVGKIEHLSKVTQTYRDVLDIVGRDVLDKNGKLTEALNEQAFNLQRNHTHALKSQLDFIDNALGEAKKLYDEAVKNGYNQQVLDSLKADVEKYEDERQSTYESWLDSWKEECQLAKNYYEDSLNQILKNFEDTVAGQFKNLSTLSEEFARKNEIASIYVDDYEKIYQLSKLTRDINNSLDDSTTLASKGKLRDIQKEINELQESGVEVSQYDLDVLRKKYEMAIAYEQWQDAQNAKTVVRMQRDNEGNYGYVYTADQSDVEAAEQNYEDRLHEMQVLNGDYIKSLQEQIIQAEQDCADALANLRAEDFASYEEYQAAVEQIRSDYTERVQTLYQQMDKALGNNQKLYENDWKEYSKATGYKMSADDQYIDKFNETVLSQITGFGTTEQAQSAFVGAVQGASDEAATNWENWYIRTNDAMGDAGTSMQNYAGDVEDTVEEIGEQGQKAEEDVQHMSEEFSDKYSEISNTVGNFLDEYSNYIDSMIDYNQALVDSINEVLRAYAELEGSEFDNDYDDWTNENTEWINEGDETKGEYKWRLKNTKTGEYATGTTLKNISIDADMSGKHGYDNYSFDEQGYLKASDINSTHYGNFGGETVNEEEYWRRHQLGWYDTGGYTGEWGDSSGRLAVLHEKELVLNSDDTANILSAVDMIRSISNAIDLNALAAGAVFAGRGAAVVSSFGKDTLEQNVHITAEFPSVSDHNEIEEALNSLVERAAQFAGRKKF